MTAPTRAQLTKCRDLCSRQRMSTGAAMERLQVSRVGASGLDPCTERRIEIGLDSYR